jgi:hypothetical protein
MSQALSQQLDKGEGSSMSHLHEESSSQDAVDTVLELFEPLFRGGDLDRKTVRGIRENVQAAITKNKVNYSFVYILRS